MYETSGAIVKRRAAKKPDWEARQLKKLTTLSLTEQQMRERLLADKAAFEAKLKELFAWRNMVRKAHGTSSEEARQAIVAHHNELIASVSAELRTVKEQLK